MKGNVIVITSGKGGVGKTTATASIGAALAVSGSRVAVVDMDIGLRNLDVVMGLENRIVFNVVDAVKGKCKPSQAAIKDRRIENLFLIPASQSDTKNAMDASEVKAFIEMIRSEYDYILVDCPAGIEQGFQNAVAAADEAVVVCTPEVSSIRDADRIIGLLLAREIAPKLVVNRIMPQMVENGDMLSHEDVVDVLSIDLLGLVEMDEQVIVSTNTGVPLVLQKDSSAGKAFGRIAARIEGNELPIEVPRVDSGFFKRMGRKLGLSR
ncbi:MAG: septum site-determining protein MinD [Desulfobacterales bacterium]|nr:septum site-determining protein MinD [Desulfobacterales bacterium]